jgi:hypothetical protein
MHSVAIDMKQKTLSHRWCRIAPITKHTSLISDAPTPNINRQLDSNREIEIFSRFDPGIVDVIPIFL